jgi:hypothetical protein
MNDKLFVFVLMPFDKDFDDTYKFGIKSTCQQLDIYCERVDEQFFEESILDRIYNQIIKADIIISDMTGRNPNVFYETGYAHAFAKKVILLTKSEADIPFDLKHYSHIIYGQSISTLREELTKRLEWYKSNPTEKELVSSEGFHYYFQGVRLEEGIEIKINNRSKNISSYNSFNDSFDFVFQLDIHNPTDKLIDIKQRLSVITSNFFPGDRAEKVKTIQLENSKYLHIYDSYGHPFFPAMWDSFSFIFLNNHWGSKPFREYFTLKIFSEVEVKEINFSIKYELI